MLSVILAPTFGLRLQLAVGTIGTDTSNRILLRGPPKLVVPQPERLNLSSRHDMI